MCVLLVLLERYMPPSSRLHWNLWLEKLMLWLRRRKCDPDPIDLFSKQLLFYIIVLLFF
jgi:hypothetical protein